MANFYIIATKKSSTNPDSVEHIEAYGIYTGNKTLEGKWLYKVYTKSEFFNSHYNSSNNYYSYNIKTKDQAELYVREITPGKPFLQSKPDQTKKDNLLLLDDIN